MATAEDNLTLQVDEIEALSAIYGDEWCVVDEASRVYCIKVTDGSDQPIWSICLQVLLPPDYPGEAPPIYQINASWLNRDERMYLCNSLEELYGENLRGSIIYLWVEKIREFLTAKTDFSKHKLQTENKSIVKSEDLAVSSDIELPPIIHGSIITDRRSTFQAHLVTPIVVMEQVKLALETLKKNKKIDNATHNIMAYRIYKEDRKCFLQDCNDDGEEHAGSRLLHLLQILDIHNAVVVVSRWYGGVPLGPDRFKHINNCARSVLKQAGFIKDKFQIDQSNEKLKKLKTKKCK